MKECGRKFLLGRLPNKNCEVFFINISITKLTRKLSFDMLLENALNWNNIEDKFVISLTLFPKANLSACAKGVGGFHHANGTISKIWGWDFESSQLSQLISDWGLVFCKHPHLFSRNGSQIFNFIYFQILFFWNIN